MMSRPWHRLALGMLTLLLWPAGQAATPDKSGVKPSAISLPSGAGSIEGLGESFEPQLNTGSSTYGVSIVVPPGRAGLQPKLRLAYNSSLGNSFLGLGWSLEFPAIRRQTDKGFPTYSPADVFVFNGEELVPLGNADGDWRCENEGAFERIRQFDADGDFVPDSWEVTDRQGTRHYYGQHRGMNQRWSAISNPMPREGAATPFDRTYSWALDTTIDLHNNRIEYEYLNPNGDANSSGTLYPARIRYSFLNGNYHEVLFRYEDRLDQFDDFRPGFAITIGKRLVGIDVRSFYDGAVHAVRSYAFEFQYRLEDAIATVESNIDLGVSTLKRVVQLDRSGRLENFLPPLLFQYSPMNLDQARLNGIEPPELDIGEAGGNVQIADVDGDGRPDLFKTESGLTGEQIVCLNRGESSQSTNETTRLVFSPAKIVAPSFAGFRLADPNSTLMDADGDGLTDFVRVEGAGITKELHVFRNKSTLDRPGPAGFSDQAEVIYDVPRAVDFGDPAMRQMDFNFDKESDFITFHPGLIGSFTYYYRERQSGSWRELGPIPANGDMTPFDLRFAINGESNPRVHLADMNGDRLLDLVYLDMSGSGLGATLVVRYWPYSGLGRWAGMQQMEANVGDAFQVDSLDLHNVVVQDLTGDGLADIAVIKSEDEGSSLTLRFNIAGRKWSAAYIRDRLPRYLPQDFVSPTTFRQADLNGNGSTDLIWRNQTTFDNTWKWLELIPNTKPNLLTGIDNGLGKVTEITYGSSTEDMIRAETNGYPWQTKCPFPLQVVRRIRTTCGLDLDGVSDAGRMDAAGNPVSTDQYVSEFQYRDAYYDGFEREFRGFGFAQRIDYGDEWLLETNMVTMGRAPGWNPAKPPLNQVSSPSVVTRFRYLTGAADGVDNDDYRPGYNGDLTVDEVTPLGGREEEILKGRQVWEEKVDAQVLQGIQVEAGFDRGCYLALTSTNAVERARMTPNDFVYTRARQEWTVRRLYRPALVSYVSEGVTGPQVLAAPPGRFESNTGKTNVLEGQGGSGRSVSFAFVSKVETETLEANGFLSSASFDLPFRHPRRDGVLSRTKTNYDDFGNQVLDENEGIVGGTFDDERRTEITYALGGQALTKWIIGKPASKRVTDENGTFVSREDHFYDGPEFVGLPLGEIGDRALETRVASFVNGSNPSPPIEEASVQIGDPKLPLNYAISTSRKRFDQYGNTVAVLDPLGNPTALNDGHSREMAFDEVFTTFPVRETIHVGGGSADLTMRAFYDFGFGVLTNVVDFNEKSATFEYDSFARLVAIVKPGDTVALPTALFEYTPANPVRRQIYRYDRSGNLVVVSSGTEVPASRVISKLREEAGVPGVYVTVNYTDGCGRALASVKEGDLPGRWIISGATRYSRRMQPSAKWQPFEVQIDGDDQAPPEFSQVWPNSRPPLLDVSGREFYALEKYHDSLAREISATNPPEKFAIANLVRTRSFTQLLPFEKRIYDENDSDPASPNYNTPMVQLNDGLGRLIEVREVVRLNDDGTPGTALTEWPTRYRYDLNDNLTHITDSQNNEKWFRYDGLKRKLFMNDPDRGVMYYHYDEAFNLRATVDAKSQRIVYGYDGVNRLLTEHYRPTNQPPDVTYHYDVPFPNLPLGDGTVGTATNTKGMLAWVQDLSGEEHTSYDERARVEYVVKRIPDPQFLAPNLPGEDQNTVGLVSYRTGFAYDSLDRVTTLTYADNDEVSYLYSPRNLLRRITGGPSGSIISNIVYRASDQLAQIEYGNGVRTHYDYDPRLRLDSLLTISHPATTNLQLINFIYAFDGVSNIKSITDNRPESAVPYGDPRRNTQHFAYDDLYRITHVNYSFGPPGTVANNGVIQYWYDRIGNMLAQTSDIQHFAKGFSVTDLGSMSYGGASGRTNRVGRLPTGSPGPHALTQTYKSPAVFAQPVLHTYPYDANGNITQIDGLTNTWDFKDRLVAVENAEMRAIYTYDHSDRRISKRVFPKVWPSIFNSQITEATIPNRPTCVLYVDKYFEVREFDAPTKYVWNGNTRIARVTGSLDTDQRVQRLRLWPGWNLCSVAVTAKAFLAQILRSVSVSNAALSAFRWDTPSRSWISVTANDTLVAGTVLWLYASTNAIVNATGIYVPPVNPTVQAGPNFQPGAGLEAWPLSSGAQMNTEIWKFDGPNQAWFTHYRARLAVQPSFPSTLAVGEGFMARGDGSSTLEVPESALRIRYYHQDHLGGSSVLADSYGKFVSEVNNYPFGLVRKEVLSQSFHEPYQFTQKESDLESDYIYFEARFVKSGIGRFLSTDPTDLTKERTGFPQRLNIYCYAVNNPIKYIDPTGRDIYLYFYGSSQTESGAGHVAVGIETHNAAKPKEQIFYEAAPETSSWKAPMADTGIVGSQAEVLAKGHTHNSAGEIQLPTLILRIKTDVKSDLQAAAKAKSFMAENKDWNFLSADCADLGKTVLRGATQVNPGRAFISSTPQELAQDIFENNSDLLKSRGVEVVRGDLVSYGRESAVIGVAGRATDEAVQSVSKALQGVSNLIRGDNK